MNQIVDYYAGGTVSFSDAYTRSFPPGTKGIGHRTSPAVCGLVFPLAGCARFVSNGVSYTIEPGMVIHAGPDMPLDREVIGGDMWRYAVIHYRIPQEEIAGASLYDKYFPIHTGLNARLTELVEQQLQTCNIPGGLAALRSKTIFAILMEELILSAQRQLQDGSTEAMVKAAEYMRIHFAEPLSVAQLAMQFGFNRRRFAYLFEKQTGMSPGFYLGECRIRRSKELLRTCDSSVAVIAEAVGYADSFYFSRYFKKQTGLSPTEYRKQFRNRS